MQIPLISKLFGLGGPTDQPSPDGEKVDAFAQLLSLVPGKGGETEGEGSALPDLGVPIPLPAGAQAAMHAELATALQAALAQGTATAAAPVAGKQLPVDGKRQDAPGKELPPLALPASQLANTSSSDAQSAQAQSTDPQSLLAQSLAVAPLVVAPLAVVPTAFESPISTASQAPVTLASEMTALDQGSRPEAKQNAPLTFSDLALLRGTATTQFREPGAGVTEQQAAAAAPLTMPLVQGPLRSEKDRAASAMAQARGEVASPPPEIAISLARPSAERAPLAHRLAEASAPLAQPAPAAQPVPQFSEVPASPEPQVPSPSSEQPALPEIELAAVIDRLVNTRLQSREGRSEVNVPHPDFGRVTLALSLAEKEMLGLSMPDAPVELRVAVGQAFASSPRGETSAANPVDTNGATAFADARSGEQRRDTNASANSQQSRADQQRAAREEGRSGQSDHLPAERRSASGRGVLA